MESVNRENETQPFLFRVQKKKIKKGTHRKRPCKLFQAYMNNIDYI